MHRLLRYTVALGVISCFTACVAQTETSTPQAPPPLPSASEVASKTAAGGLARVRVQVNAHMPSDFDDGQPERSFKGRGVVDQGRSIAGVYFSTRKVPNAAGYLGHVDPTMSVVYEGSRFIVSFPQLAELLADPVDWVSYDLDVLSDPVALRLGIGQLREIGLSDPRLANGFLAGTSDELQAASPGTDPYGDTYIASVDVASAAEASGDDLRPIFEGLIRLGVTSVDVEVGLDTEGRLGSFAYSLSYPPKEGSEPVQLDVTMQFPAYGVQRGLRAPRDAAVVSYDEYFVQAGG